MTSPKGIKTSSYNVLPWSNLFERIEIRCLSFGVSLINYGQSKAFHPGNHKQQQLRSSSNIPLQRSLTMGLVLEDVSRFSPKMHDPESHKKPSIPSDGMVMVCSNNALSWTSGAWRSRRFRVVNFWPRYGWPEPKRRRTACDGTLPRWASISGKDAQNAPKANWFFVSVEQQWSTSNGGKS